MHVVEPEIVPDAGEVRIEPQRLRVKDEAFFDAPIFRQNRCEGVPQHRLTGEAVDRTAYGLDRLIGVAAIAHDAGEIVVTLRRVGPRLYIKAEQALRAFQTPRVPCGQAEI